jgi:hypothetical protein
MPSLLSTSPSVQIYELCVVFPEANDRNNAEGNMYVPLAPTEERNI